jgi:hypothetical protein
MAPRRNPRTPPPPPPPCSPDSSSSDDPQVPAIERIHLRPADISERTGVNLALLQTYLHQQSNLAVEDGVSFLVAHALYLRMRAILSHALSLSRLRVGEPADSAISDLPALPFALLTAEQRFLAGDPPDAIGNPEFTHAFVTEGPDGRPLADLAASPHPESVRGLLPAREREMTVSLHDVIAALKKDRTVDLNKLQAAKGTVFA